MSEDQNKQHTPLSLGDRYRIKVFSDGGCHFLFFYESKDVHMCKLLVWPSPEPSTSSTCGDREDCTGVCNMAATPTSQTQDKLKLLPRCLQLRESLLIAASAQRLGAVELPWAVCIPLNTIWVKVY